MNKSESRSLIFYFFAFVCLYTVIWFSCIHSSVTGVSQVQPNLATSFHCPPSNSSSVSHVAVENGKKQSVVDDNQFMDVSSFASLPTPVDNRRFSQAIRACAALMQVPNPFIVVESKSNPSFAAALHTPGEDIFISGSLLYEESDIFMYSELEQLRSIAESTPNLRSDVVIDVGANIGIFSLYMASHGKTVYSFEPVPANYEKIAFSACMNKQLYNRNMTTFHNIVSNETGKSFPMASFYNNKGHSGVLTGEEVGFNASEMRYTSSPVNTTTLDSALMDICDPLNPPLMMKIDVEGFEGFVLDGARTIMKTCPPSYIFIELNKKFIEGNAHSPMSLLDIFMFIKTSGYSLTMSPNFFGEDDGGPHRYAPSFWRNDTRIKEFVEKLHPVFHWGDYLFYHPPPPPQHQCSLRCKKLHDEST
jgi:FkbM family methyltransferase